MPPNLGQLACLLLCIFGNIYYASISAFRSQHFCLFERRREEGRYVGESKLLSQLNDHTLIKTEALDVDAPTLASFQKFATLISKFLIKTA